MRSILGTLRNIALSGLALSAGACGGETAPEASSSGATSSGAGGGSSGNPLEGLLKVECRSDQRGTDLAGAREELGLDYLGVHHYGGAVPSVSSEGGPACTAECAAKAKEAVDAAQAALDQSTETDEERRPWSSSGMEGRFARVLLTAKGGTYTSIHNRQELRALLGSLDTPWKAHLWVHLTGEIDVSCRPYAGGNLETAAYVRPGSPVGVIGVLPARSCTDEGIAYRVEADVAPGGAISETERSEIWRGPTACEGRIPDALAREQMLGVLDGSAASEGAYFARMAYFEAAAVHAFATLVEELTPYGLPEDLRRDLARARRDEVRHARMMTTLARRYGHEPEIPTFAPCTNRTLEQIALENAVEGCVRETYGAVVGVMQADRAAQASVRQVMRAIAEDELFHADVSWRLHAWLQGQLDERARDRVRAARAAAVAAQREQLQQAQPAIGAALGLPEPAVALALHDRLQHELWAAA